ncbi:hypothetical protein BDF21DRAFT_418181 [Thamnidium elegans]|nr:hypothetical protein BDF21DRAFT_418181 [Thamnidium elegans]
MASLFKKYFMVLALVCSTALLVQAQNGGTDEPCVNGQCPSGSMCSNGFCIDAQD